MAPHEKTVMGGYPFATIPILIMEMAQALAFYGISVILTVYMLEWLGMSEETSIAVYHTYTVLAYVFCIFGGMIADGKLGRFRTMLIASGIFILGFLLLSFTSFSKELYGYVIGLILVALGAAGIRPTVPAIGADQFTKDQAPQREHFFGLYYIFRNIGSFAGFIILPILRAYVDCYKGKCYPLAFGFPALVMILATLFLCTTSKFFKETKPTGDIISKFIGCIVSAIKGKSRVEKEKRNHWLDYADTSKYSEDFIQDTRSVLRVLVMMLPWPFFWALYDQLGSSWIIQAKEMNGQLGSIIIYPDQLSAANSLFIVIFIPLVHIVVYPLLNRFNIPNTFCQRIGVGMFVVGTSFILGGILQFVIHNGNPVELKESESRVRFVNTLPCSIHVDGRFRNFNVPSDRSKVIFLKSGDSGDIHIQPKGCQGMISLTEKLELYPKEDTYVIVHSLDQKPDISKVNSSFSGRQEQGSSGLRIINVLKQKIMVEILDESKKEFHHTNITDGITDHQQISSGSYFISIDGKEFPVSLENGGLYTVILHKNTEDQIDIVQYEDVPPYKINIFWQLPQFLLLSLGETFFSVNALDFTYSEAPPSMKSVLTGFYLLTSAFGNLLVAVLSSVLIFDNLGYVFFTYAGLDFIGLALFIILAINYTYVDHEYSTTESVHASYTDTTSLDDKDNKKLSLVGVDNIAFLEEQSTRF